MNPEDELQDCLAQLEAGRAAEDLVRERPELRAEIEAAATLRQWPAPGLRPGAAALFLARWAQQRRYDPARRAALRWAVALSLVGVVTLSGLGAGSAMADSLPGEWLYPVKRALEAAQMALAAPSDQAAVHASLAAARLDELTALATLGVIDSELVAELSAETRSALDAVAGLPSDQQAAALQHIVEQAERQQTVLAAVLAGAPPSARAGLERALAASAAHEARARGLLGEAPPVAAPTGAQPTARAGATRTGRPAATVTSTKVAAPTEPAPSTADAETPGSQISRGNGLQTSPNTPGPRRTPEPPGCNPNNQRACGPEATATPQATRGDGSVAEPTPADTPCPTNPAGKPVCK